MMNNEDLKSRFEELLTEASENLDTDTYISRDIDRMAEIFEIGTGREISPWLIFEVMAAIYLSGEEGAVNA